MAKDWEGHEIVGEESPDTVIKVWEITPHADPQYDYAVIRGYQDAMAFAKSVVEDRMDLMDINGDAGPSEIKIRVVEMTLDEYREITDG